LTHFGRIILFRNGLKFALKTEEMLFNWIAGNHKEIKQWIWWMFFLLPESQTIIKSLPL